MRIFQRLVSEAGGRTVEVYPERQIVLAMLSCVTAGSNAPGVQAGSGSGWPSAAVWAWH